MNFTNFSLKKLREYEKKLSNGYILNGIDNFLHDASYKNDFGEHIWKPQKAKQLKMVREELETRIKETYGIKKTKRSHFKKNQFFPFPFSVLDNPIFQKEYLKSNKLGTFMWLARNIVRGKMNNDHMNIYENYYQKGKLAVCITTRGFKKQIDTPKSTANDHINQLAADGIIKTIKVPKRECYDNQERVICVLGIHKDGREHWFISDAFDVSDKPYPVSEKNTGGVRKFSERCPKSDTKSS